MKGLVLRLVIGIVSGLLLGFGVTWLGKTVHIPMIARGAIVGALVAIVLSFVGPRAASAASG
jgi:hypothetical protein